MNKSIYHAMPAMLCREKKVLGYKGNRSVRDAPACSYNLLEGTGQSQSGESNPVRTSGWELFDHWDQSGPKKCACVVGANPFDIDLVIFLHSFGYVWDDDLEFTTFEEKVFTPMTHGASIQLKHTKYRTPSMTP